MIVGGSLAGGILAYLVVDYILYKTSGEVGFEKGEKDDGITTLEEADKMTRVMPSRKGEKDDGIITLEEADKMTRVMPSSQELKPALADLVRLYGEDPVGADEPKISIVPYSLVKKYTKQTGSGIYEETIYFYDGDDTFTYLDDAVVEDPTEFFGPNVHLHFGEGSESPDKVYVWNGFLQTFFVISLIHDSYKYAVQGQPRPVKVKPKRLRKAAVVKTTDLTDELYEEDGPGELNES